MRRDVNWERSLACILAGGVIIFFLYFLLNPPELNSTTLPILRFVAATAASLLSYLFVGSLHLEGKLPFSRLQIKAGSAFAVFIIVFILFNAGTPADSSYQNGHLFSDTKIVQAIKNPVANSGGGPVVATQNGNGAVLTVSLENIPKRISSKNYKLVSFARKSDNPSWDYQEMADLSGEPVPMNLRLWADPAGDKSSYEAISIISSTFTDSSPKTYNPYDLDRLALKKSAPLTFYRDDSRTETAS